MQSESTRKLDSKDEKAAFADLLAKGHTLKSAAFATGVSTVTVLKRRRDDPEFDELVKDAIGAGVGNAGHMLMEIGRTSKLDFARIAALNSFLAQHDRKIKQCVLRRKDRVEAELRKGVGPALAAFFPDIAKLFERWVPEEGRPEFLADFEALVTRLQAGGGGG